MKLTIFTAILLAILLIFAAPAYAQVTVSGAIGAHAVPNQSGNNRFDNVGLSADLSAHIYQKYTVGGSIVGADNNPSRAFYFASYNVGSYGKHSVALGGGFHTFGSLTRGFGQADYWFADKYRATLRVGSYDTVHLEAAVKLAQFGEYVSIWPTYTYYHTEFGRGRFDTDIHTVGLKVAFKGKD
jgi:hypothetical protein